MKDLLTEIGMALLGAALAIILIFLLLSPLLFLTGCVKGCNAEQSYRTPEKPTQYLKDNTYPTPRWGFHTGPRIKDGEFTTEPSLGWEWDWK